MAQWVGILCLSFKTFKLDTHKITSIHYRAGTELVWECFFFVLMLDNFELAANQNKNESLPYSPIFYDPGSLF
jgi:hypothetical protein